MTYWNMAGKRRYLPHSFERNGQVQHGSGRVSSVTKTDIS